MKILITGAGRGIGLDTALKLVSDGNLVIAISRKTEKLEQFKLQFKNEIRDNLRIISFDLLSQDFGPIRAEIKAIGGIDILINNAGDLINKPFSELNAEDWQKMLDINLLAPVRLIRELLPYFSRDIKSHILNISSMGGVQGTVKFPGLSAYASSKGALCLMTEVLAAELAEDSIAVNCLALGAVDTEMLQEAFPGYKAPLTSLEMAEFIANFAQTGWKYFNGKIIPVSVSTP